MNKSISKVVAAIVIGFGEITVAGNTNTKADYIAAIERYDIEAWAASYDSVDRHEVTTGTDRGAQVYVYRDKGNVQRVIFDYALSHTNTLYCLLYKDGKLVKVSHSRRGYRYGKDAELVFSQPYPEEETNRTYFWGSEVVCLSSDDKCEAIRSDPAKQEAILRGASDLLRQLSTMKPKAEVPDVDFLKYL